MTERPELSRELDSATFRSFYYLKDELTEFCRRYGIPASGGKTDITDRIAHFLDTGEILAAAAVKRVKCRDIAITPDTPIESDFACTEKHRAFFREQIGGSFSFNVAFQRWLKSNAGKTYGDAIYAYRQIIEEKKSKKTQIEKQFEYNTYIRDFFADNKGKTLNDAIRCWKYKKQLQGHNRYERSDLAALEAE